MKRARMIAAGAVAALTLGVGAGFAVAQTDPTTTPAVGAQGVQADDMDTMHAQMRSNMPADLQDQCDTMHASMQGQMGSMMGGPMTMMDGPMTDQ